MYICISHGFIELSFLCQAVHLDSLTTEVSRQSPAAGTQRRHAGAPRVPGMAWPSSRNMRRYPVNLRH